MNAPVQFEVAGEPVVPDEMVKLCAIDNELFLQTFFPKTVRQASAPFHRIMDEDMADPNARLVHHRVFRGGAKTTRGRTFMAKRIAYGLSRTVLYVGASEGHAARSIQWLRGQIERNKPFTTTFGLAPGKKWIETECEIVNQITGDTAWVLGVGITGNIRGINFDDYRPDLIYLDDILTDENTFTLEQRQKIIDLVDGALEKSLAPRSEEPNAKMVFHQTPIHPEDASHVVERDRRWRTRTFPCWTSETLDLAVEEQESSWPTRFPSIELRADKREAARLNKLSSFVREMECRIISKEAAAFRSEWLQRLPELPPPHTTFNYLAIDPVPPPSDREVAKGLQGKHFEAIVAVGRAGPGYYVHEYAANRGHEPNWTIWKIFDMAKRFGVSKIVVEGIAYQKTLKWILEQEMRRRGIYYQIELVTDKRSKYTKIVSTMSGIASNGQLFCSEGHTDFIQQWEHFPSEPDDILDAAALGLSKLVNPALEHIDPAVLGIPHKRIRMRGHP